MQTRKDLNPLKIEIMLIYHCKLFAIKKKMICFRYFDIILCKSETFMFEGFNIYIQKVALMHFQNCIFCSRKKKLLLEDKFAQEK